jgi:hypothetical protein
MSDQQTPTPAEKPQQPSTPSPENTHVITAEEIHANLLKTHRIGNIARHRFAQWLLALHESELYIELGYSSTPQYAEARFRLCRTETYDVLRVARALPGLPATCDAYDSGKITWSDLEEITRIADGETEADWLEFAEKHPREELKGEVADALSEKRRRPRKNGRGIPTLKTKVTLRFTSEQRAMYRLALQKAGEEYGRGLGGERMTPEQTILILMQRMLETDPSGTPKGRKEKEDSIYTILYHNCTICNETHLVNGRERVKVSPETLARVEGEARKVEIKPEEERPLLQENPEPRNAPATVPSEERDHKNTPLLVKKVLLRDGQCCVNPFCKRRLGLQAHHIVFLCQGGKTILCNECALCATCHALVHQGLLEILGTSPADLRFIPRVNRLNIDARVDAELAELGNVPAVQIPARQVSAGPVQSGYPDCSRQKVKQPNSSENPDSPGQSGYPDCSRRPEMPARILEDLVQILKLKFGYRIQAARERIQQAFERLLSRGQVSEWGEVLGEACRNSW